MAGVASEKRRLRQLIQRAGVAILMTTDGGAHVGRPMLPLLLDGDGDIYFLTHRHSRKVAQIAVQPQVGLTVTTPHCYIVLTGHARVLTNPEIVRKLWHPTYRAWFPDGTDDREAAALRVVVERVDYWEPPRSAALRVAQAVKAVLTRRAVETPMKTIDGL
jgi:general stress protein 26